MSRVVRRWTQLCVALLALGLTATLTSVPAQAIVRATATPVLSSNTTNPLAGRPWGNYESKFDGLSAAYAQASGSNKSLLAEVALRPRARWFGVWTADTDITHQLSEYITTANGGNPNVEVQVALFRLNPWEGAACSALPTAAQQASYKRWINNAAAAIGSNHVAVILQPDLPFAFCVPHRSLIPLSLVSYATQTLSRLAHTSVYIDAGAMDWRNVEMTAWLVRMAGVRWARGFALNATHFDSTASEVRFGAQINSALSAKGIYSRHFIVDTVQNGQPFHAGQVSKTRFANMTPCRRLTGILCSRLGIPPTTDVANPKWGLPADVNSIASRQVDGYMWFGRPWNRPGGFFTEQYALDLARNREFPNQ